MGIPEHPESHEHTQVLHEAESIVGSDVLDAIEEHHGQMFAVWGNYLKYIKGVGDAHPLTVDQSNKAFSYSHSQFVGSVTTYTDFILEQSESEHEAAEVLLGLGLVLDRERVDTLNDLSVYFVGATVSHYSEREAIMAAFQAQLEGSETEDERRSAFLRLVTAGFSDDMQALDDLITRVKTEVHEEEELSQREMIRFIYEKLQEEPKNKMRDHALKIAKTGLSVAIGFALARRLK